MTRLKLHHRLPLIGRPFLQRNQARLERDHARRQLAEACLDRDQARLERDQALKERVRLGNDAAALSALFAPPGHYYSPIVDPVEADCHFARLEAGPIPLSLAGIAVNREQMIEKWNSLLPYLREVPFPQCKASGFRYAFDNIFYSWGDGSILYAMLRSLRPQRFIEVGGGWSSACALDTAERHFNRECEFTFVDPYPQMLRSLCGELASNMRIIETPIQQAPLAPFEALEAGDVLFIDSTHILRTGGDVCFELFEVLPRLASGVAVHFHDMFWPFEYPRKWAVDEKRSWNELYAVRAFLTNNDVFFNDYLAKTERKLVAASYPDFLKNAGGALWLQRA
jgi:hypothetical protein